MSIDNARYRDWLQIFLKYIRERGLPAHVREDEGYKFEAVQNFQANFDIEATDLAGNLDTSLLNNNLVAGAMYFPKKMLLIYARDFPEETRSILQLLFDEKEDVGFRIDQAKQAFEDLETRRDNHDKKYANTYIGLRFLSLLLSYYDPNQYNALKPAEWKVFCRFINPDFSMPNRTPAGEQYKIYCQYIEPLRNFLKTRREIDEIREALTEGLLFKDQEYRWVTQDVIFVTARVYADNRASEFTAEPQEKAPDVEHAQPKTVEVDEFNTGFMAYEQHLEEYVIKNWDNIDFGERYTIYHDDDGTTGQQYTTDVGIIDILAQDEANNFVVIELKRAESGYKVVGQTLNYMGWVQDRLAGDGQKVRGLIIVGRADKTLRAAVRPVTNMIDLKEYRIKMSFESPQ